VPGAAAGVTGSSRTTLHRDERSRAACVTWHTERGDVSAGLAAAVTKRAAGASA